MEFRYKNSSQVSPQEIKTTVNSLSSYTKELCDARDKNNYSSCESFINLPFDAGIKNLIKQSVKKKIDKNLKYIVHIGTGGANTATKAVYDALYGFFDVLDPTRFSKVIFLDNSDSGTLNKVINLLNNQIKTPREVLIHVVSKSGVTAETVYNFELMLSTFPEFEQRVIAVVGSGSRFYELLKEKNVTTIPVLEKIEDRYSAFSVRSLLTLFACGLDIDLFIKGAKSIVEKCLQESLGWHLPVVSASIIFNHYKRDKRILDNFFFNPELESLGKWYRQVLAESVGKDGKGITPTVSIGTKDLHSVAQLTFDGPKDKLTHFFWAKNQYNKATLPDKLSYEGLVSNIEGKSTRDFVSAMYGGVKSGYAVNNLPFCEILVDDVSLYSLGQYMQFKMLEVVFLAKLMRVNAFNQPAVEDYKSATRKILASH